MRTVLLSVEENTQVMVTESTQYVLDLSNTLPGKQYLVQLNFKTPGVESEIIGLYKLNDGEALDLVTVANHQVPHTSCDTKIKGVLGNNARSSYIGKILIAKPAQQTSSFLHDSVLVLGDNTANRSDPVLEIEANDVQASHGATTGRIDEMQIYYLMSRGLSRNEAEELVVKGFYESLLAEIKDATVRGKVSALLN